jgi:diguanylate cyclase
LVLGGCLLAGLQLAIGAVIGYWFRRPKQEPNVPNIYETGAIAKRLQELALEMSSSVGDHVHQLRQATKQLTASDSGGTEIAELVVDVINGVVSSNHNLQAKLDTAEGRLQEQAVEIEAHISRSLTDPLTGLPNRREFNERLEERMGAWSRRQEVFTLLLIDVDHFKKLNDSHGHLVGDQVLSALGRTLRAAIRREDAVARFGGEEFAALLPNTTLEEAAAVAQKVREAVARIVVPHKGYEIRITVSGGLASIQAGDDVQTLIERADAALYAAKAAGRNCTISNDGRRMMGTGEVAADNSHESAAHLRALLNEIPSESPKERASGESPESFGSFLAAEKVSPALAETCSELRQFVECGSLTELPTLPAT